MDDDQRTIEHPKYPLHVFISNLLHLRYSKQITIYLLLNTIDLEYLDFTHQHTHHLTRIAYSDILFFTPKMHHFVIIDPSTES